MIHRGSHERVSSIPQIASSSSSPVETHSSNSMISASPSSSSSALLVGGGNGNGGGGAGGGSGGNGNGGDSNHDGNNVGESISLLKNATGVTGTPSNINSINFPPSDKKDGGAPSVVAQAEQYNVYLRYGSLFLLVVQNCSAVLLMRYVQSPSREPFCVPCLNLLVEVLKLAICVIAIVYSAADKSMQLQQPVLTGIIAGFHECYDCLFKDVPESMKMAVPAALFTIQNNLLFVALANLDATLFQVTYQLKLLATALLMVVMLGRELSRSKWMSLILLFFGIILTQVKPSARKADENSSMAIGMSAVVTCAFMSAFASVYFEKVLKSQGSVSLAVRNVQLAVFSLVFNLVAMQLQTMYRSSSSSSSSNASQSMMEKILTGFDGLLWVVVLVQAAGGLLVAAVIKYADNILKGFATAVAIVVNGLISYVWLEFEPTQMFLVGAIVVISATMMYSVLP